MPDPAQYRASPASVGAARLLALTYGFFVLAAGARSGVQLATAFCAAPLAYLLSAAAALVYTAGLVVFVIAERNPARRRWALWLGAVELAGVLGVGVASELFPAAFPDATVWSGFGSGYAFVPAILPVLAMCWATRRPATRRPAPHAARPEPSGERIRPRGGLESDLAVGPVRVDSDQPAGRAASHQDLA